MSENNCCDLKDRALIALGGEEAESFLQGILTCNVEAIEAEGAGFGGLLTPQGKILFDFFVIRTGCDFLLDAPKDSIDDLIKRLTFYRLRAKVTIAASDLSVNAYWNEEKPQIAGAITVSDPRLAAMGWRVYSSKLPSCQGDYETHRISQGMPEGGKDYGYGEVFPHEALYDQNGGVDFAKGCYVGQEVVSRMHHRGTARKRIIQIDGNSPLPERGTKITAGGKSVGEMGSHEQNSGLAILRLDRVKTTMDGALELMAGDVSAQVNIQSWAKFSWPDA